MGLPVALEQDLSTASAAVLPLQCAQVVSLSRDRSPAQPACPPPLLTVAGSTMNTNTRMAAAASSSLSTNLTERLSTAAFLTASRCVAVCQVAMTAPSTTFTPSTTTMPPHQDSSMPYAATQMMTTLGNMNTSPSRLLPVRPSCRCASSAACGAGHRQHSSRMWKGARWWADLVRSASGLTTTLFDQPLIVSLPALLPTSHALRGHTSLELHCNATPPTAAPPSAAAPRCTAATASCHCHCWRACCQPSSQATPWQPPAVGGGPEANRHGMQLPRQQAQYHKLRTTCRCKSNPELHMRCTMGSCELSKEHPAVCARPVCAPCCSASPG